MEERVRLFNCVFSFLFETGVGTFVIIFFFQAEDGIRDLYVTGVQTCALPISCGVPSEPNVFYMGAVNGGVWRSDDYGRTWNPMFDGQPTESIGAIAVAPSDPNIIYVGSGEGLARPDLSLGDGVYKSTDAGK